VDRANVWWTARVFALPADDLSEEVHHLLGPCQTGEIAVSDDAVEAVIDERYQVAPNSWMNSCKCLLAKRALHYVKPRTKVREVSGRHARAVP
jgi:hypothetical protein